MSDYIKIYSLEKDENDLNLNELYLISRKSGRITYFAKSVVGWRSTRDSSDSSDAMLFKTKEAAEEALKVIQTNRSHKKYVHRYKIQTADKYFYQTWEIDFYDGGYWSDRSEHVKVKRVLKNIKNIKDRNNVTIRTIDEALNNAQERYKRTKEDNIKYLDERVEEILQKKQEVLLVEEKLKNFDITKYKNLQIKNDRIVGLLYDNKKS